MVGKWAIPTAVPQVSCSGYNDVLTFGIMDVVFRHHVVLHSSIIGPTTCLTPDLG